MHLPQLQTGSCGTIEAISEHGGLAKRLADLGFVRGAEVTMVKRGSPCIVSIQGRCIGLGAAGQRHIRLRSSPAGAVLVVA